MANEVSKIKVDESVNVLTLLHWMPSSSILAWALLLRHASPAPLLSPLCCTSGTHCFPIEYCH